MAVVGQLMRALRWNGIANIDLIQSRDRQVFVLEVNPRCWGNMAAAIPLGLDFASMLCQAALDQPIARQRCRSGRFFDALDTVALLCATLVNRKTRSQLNWWRLLRSESSLPVTLKDPLPSLTAAIRNGPVRGAMSLLREALIRHAPLLEEPR